MPPPDVTFELKMHFKMQPGTLVGKLVLTALPRPPDLVPICRPRSGLEPNPLGKV